MPAEAAAAVDTFGEILPDLDVVGALARCTNDEVHAALSMHPPRQVAKYLGRIGVHARGTRPRQIGQMRMRLSQGLRTQDWCAVELAHIMAEPTYKVLVVRTTGLIGDLPHEAIKPAVDTPALRAFALAVALRMPDPSAPLMLAGMLEEDDPAVLPLFAEDEIAELRKRAEQLRADWNAEWTSPLKQWARQRCELDDMSAEAHRPRGKLVQHQKEPTRPPESEATPPAQDNGVAGDAVTRNTDSARLFEANGAGSTAAAPPAPALKYDPDLHTPDLAALHDRHAAVTISAQQVLDAVTARRSANDSDLAAISNWSTAMRAAAAHLSVPLNSDLDTLEDTERSNRTQQQFQAQLTEMHH